MKKPEGLDNRRSSEGPRRKRWSLASIFNRVGLCQQAMGGKENYEAFVKEINEGLEGGTLFTSFNYFVSIN